MARTFIILFWFALAFTAAFAQQPQISLKASFAGHKKRVTVITFSPDETTLATGSEDGEIRLWQTADRTLKAVLPGHKDGVYQLVFSPSGKSLAASSRGDSTVQLWNVEAGSLRSSLPELAGKRIELHPSPDGRTLAGATNQGFALWDIETGALKGATGKLSQKQEEFQFNSTADRITTESGKDVVNLWDANNGQLIAKLPLQSPRRELKEYPFWKEPKPSFFPKAKFSPDGNLVVTFCWDWAAELWDARNGKLLATLDGHETKRNTAPSGSLLQVLLAKDLTIPDEITWASFSPDNQLVATFAWESTRIWEAKTGALKATLKRDEIQFEQWFFTEYKEVHDVSSEKLRAALVWANQFHAHQRIFSADGKTMVVANPSYKSKSKIMVFDIEAGKVRLEMLMVAKWGFSFNGEWLSRSDVISFALSDKVLVANNEKSIRLFDLADGKALLELEHGGLPTAFSASGKFFAIALKTGEVQLYELNVR